MDGKGSRLNGWRIAINGKYLTIHCIPDCCLLHFCCSFCYPPLPGSFANDTTDDSTGVCQFNCYIAISDYYLSLEQPQLYESPLSISERLMHLLHCLPSISSCVAGPTNNTCAGICTSCTTILHLFINSAFDFFISSNIVIIII